MTRAAEFKEKVHAWSGRISVTPARVQIQDMKTKWASCSSAGRLCFNRSLLRQPVEFQESVIVHELVHLLVPNHGKLFTQFIRAYRPSAESVGRCSTQRDGASGRFVKYV